MSTLSNQIEAGRAYISIRLDQAALINGLADVGKRMRAFGASVQSFGSDMMRLSLIGAVPVAAAVNSFIKFDDQMRITAAISGATERQLAALRKQARDLGSTTAFTAQQIGLGMTALARLGNNADKIRKSIEDTMYLTRATGNETWRLGEVSEIVGNIMNQYGIEMDRVKDTTDVLAFASNRSASTLQDFGQAMRSVGPIAARLQEDLRDTASSYMVLANMGIRGELAGTAMRKAYDGIISNEKALNELGVATRNSMNELRKPYLILADIFNTLRTKTRAEQVQIAKEIFGLRGMVAGMSIGISQDKVKEIRASLDKTFGYAKKTAEQMESGIGGAWRKLASMTQDLGLQIGQALDKPLSSLMNTATRILKWLRDFVKQNAHLIQSFVVLSATGAVVGASIMAIGLAIKVIAAPMNVLSAALYVLKKAILTTFVGGKLAVKAFGASFGLVMKGFNGMTRLVIKGLASLMVSAMGTAAKFRILRAFIGDSFFINTVVAVGALTAAIYGLQKSYPKVKSAAQSSLGKIKDWWNENKAAVMDFGKTLYEAVQMGDLGGALRLGMAGAVKVIGNAAPLIVRGFADMTVSIMEMWDRMTDRIAVRFLDAMKYIRTQLLEARTLLTKFRLPTYHEYQQIDEWHKNAKNSLYMDSYNKRQGWRSSADEYVGRASSFQQRANQSYNAALHDAKAFRKIEEYSKNMKEAFGNAASLYRENVRMGDADGFRGSRLDAYTTLGRGRSNARNIDEQTSRLRAKIKEYETYAESLEKVFERKLEEAKEDRKITAEEAAVLEKLKRQRGEAVYMTEEMRERLGSLTETVGEIQQNNEEVAGKERRGSNPQASFSSSYFRFGLGIRGPAERTAEATERMDRNIKWLRDYIPNIRGTVIA